VKKNRPKKSRSRPVKTVAAQEIPAINISTAPHQQSISKLQKHRRFLRTVEWVLGLPLAVIVAVYTIFGPPWPTEPSFVPLSPSFWSPFDIPYTVTNKSILFRVSAISITCKIASARTLLGDIIYNIDVRSTEINNLQPGQTSSYTCLLNKIIKLSRPHPYETKFVQAEISFASEYDSPWPFRRRIKVASNPFTLNSATEPPLWVQGVPLK
jgi:hypothetical protein